MDLGTYALGSPALDETLATALGRVHRPDPVTHPTGGPAGNAKLAAWLGVSLLIGFAVQGFTLLDIHGLLSWHIAVGALLVPVALVKTATTSWRAARYYRGDRPYLTAGPPPLAYRIAGPAVVVSTLALLGSGLTLVALGQDRAHQSIVAGFSAVTVHQVLFFIWLVPMTVHVLGRTVPAGQRLAARRLPGRGRRAALLLATAGVAALSLTLTSGGAHSWTKDGFDGPHHHAQTGATR